MTKLEVIKASHVRNEAFVGALKSIIELVPVMCCLRITRIPPASGEQGEDSEFIHRLLQLEVSLGKLMMDRLGALIDTWPNAVWFFFPETGWGGWIRLFNEFHGKISPFYFPEAPQTPLWRTKQIRG